MVYCGGMFIKITTSGGRRYVQLVESYRDESGRVKKRTVATLGRADQAGSQLESVIRGLQRLRGDTPPEAGAVATVADVRFESSRALGDVWALTELWDELGFGELRRVFGRTRSRIDVEALVRLMVLNRLCDPTSKLGVLRWLQTVALPRFAPKEVTHQHLLRAMDALVEHQDCVQAALAGLLRPLIDQDLSVVFYDMTTIGVEGQTELAGDLRQFGLSKDGGMRRQFMLGVVQTAEGLPLTHRVWEGNTAEAPTLSTVVQEVLALYPVKRVVLVADRGLLSLDNLEWLRGQRVGGTEQPVEFILAVPGRRYAEFAEILEPIHALRCAAATREVLGETRWQDLRLVWAHDPRRALEQTAARRQHIGELTQEAQQRAGKLDAQEGGTAFRGRRLSDSGAKAWLYRAVSEAHLGSIIKVDLQSDLFTYVIDDKALARAELGDGKLLLVTNVPELSALEVLRRYKSLADIERGFKILKSEIEIAPVFHRLPDRIRAHALICFIALVLYRVMRMRLKDAGSKLSPERALEQLRRIQYHQAHLGGERRDGTSSLSDADHAILQGLKLPKPAIDDQLALL
ncbi:transposase [Thiomonas sp. Bio17B3]|nr:transposase [Thiomonas sp. Bio17B3]